MIVCARSQATNLKLPQGLEVKVLKNFPTDRFVDEDFHNKWAEVSDPPRTLILFGSIVISVYLILETWLGSFFVVNPDDVFLSALEMNAKMLLGFLIILPIHEFLHLAVFYTYEPKADIYLIANIKFASVYVYTEQILSKTQFYISAITPICSLSLFPLYLLHLGLFNSNFLGMIAVLNLAASIPDVANSVFVAFTIPGKALFRNLNNKTYYQIPQR